MTSFSSLPHSPVALSHATLPLTGQNVVSMIVTGLDVFQRSKPGQPFRLIELTPRTTTDEVAAKTTALCI